MWSTNPQLIGQKFLNDVALEAAFSSKDRVSTKYNDAHELRPEQQFLHPAKMFFIESYIPLVDDLGNTLAVVEIYKEPVDLIERLERGHWIIWLSTALGGLLLYFGLYWIVRRHRSSSHPKRRNLSPTRLMWAWSRCPRPSHTVCAIPLPAFVPAQNWP